MALDIILYAATKLHLDSTGEYQHDFVMTSGAPDSDSIPIPEPETGDPHADAEFNLDAEDVRLASDEPIKVIRREPQIPYPLHTHSFAELVIILSGTGFHRVGSQELPIGAGDVYVILGNRAHGYEQLNELHLVNILFDPALLEMPLFDLTRLPGFHALFTLEPQWRGEGGVSAHLSLSPKRLDHALGHVERIEEELRCREEGYRFLAVTHFQRLIAELSRWYTGAESPGARRLSRIGAAIGYLEHHLDESVSLDTLVHLSGLSPSTLNRAFQRAVGLSPLSYHLRLRSRRAGDMLRSTDLSVTEIAYRTGFSDANYFARQFRKAMGLSPRAYRSKRS